jgi:hypothetical protein
MEPDSKSMATAAGGKIFTTNFKQEQEFPF